MDFHLVNAEATFPLRRLLLGERTRRVGDEDALHVACKVNGQIIGVASFYPQNQQIVEEWGHWRLRGMAVNPTFQGTGVGKAIINHFRSRDDVKLIWCNARLSAVGFYERLGFITSEVFERRPGVMVHRMIWHRD